MSFFGTHDFGLETSLERLVSSGYRTENKFGHAPDCDNGVPTDLWDGAFGGGIKVWIAPTAARLHTIVSLSALDNGVTPNLGLRTLRIWYLPTWDSEETFEDVIMNGITGVVMNNSAVIIHRMRGLTWGANGLNAGLITATAAVDGTTTAVVSSGKNQTLMCIYGVPSTQDLRVEDAGASIVETSGLARRATGEFLIMTDPATNAVNGTAWTNRENFDVTEGTLAWSHDYSDVPKKFDGPCIVKLQVTTDTNNTEVTGYFDAFLVDKQA